MPSDTLKPNPVAIFSLTNADMLRGIAANIGFKPSSRHASTRKYDRLFIWDHIPADEYFAIPSLGGFRRHGTIPFTVNLLHYDDYHYGTIHQTPDLARLRAYHSTVQALPESVILSDETSLARFREELGDKTNPLSALFKALTRPMVFGNTGGDSDPLNYIIR